MIVFPNAKINLGLHITGQRPDGYHTLETFFYPIPLEDILEIVPNAESSAQDELIVYGQMPDCSSEDNLVMRAVKAMRNHVEIPPLKIALYKKIPSGAGFGGGSSDAASTLLLLKDMFAPEMDERTLLDIALSLGADCPFFIKNVPCLAKGIGEELTPMEEVSLAGYHLVVVKPPIHISTAEAYKGVKQIGVNQESLAKLLHKPTSQWAGVVKNAFEETIFPQYPELKELKDTLYNQGAGYVSMSGSGSALYGIFREKPVLSQLLFKDCFVWQTSL